MCLVTVLAHSGLSKVQGKTSIHMVVEVRAARSRKLTGKGLAYKKETLRERIRKINGRFTRSTAPLGTYFFPVRT